MGCTSTNTNLTNVQTIPDPTGDPNDPLNSKAQIIDSISFDPHINYFKQQIEGALTKGSRKSKKFKNKNELQFATTNNQEYEKYIQIVNNAINGNELSTTNVLSHLFKEVADMREREEVEAKFKDDKYAALKCFVYLYTGNYAYKMVNNSLRSNQYERLAPIIALIKKQLSMFSKQNSTLANRTIGLLFRGIDKPDPTMVQKAKLYWKGFTSTALNKDIAKNFGRYQYTIALKRGLPHEYLIIPKELSHFEEEEVLIFPFFYFQVSKVVKFEANKSENYHVAQMPPVIQGEEMKEGSSEQKIFTMPIASSDI